VRSCRPYKYAFNHDGAVAVITEGDEQTQPDFYDPELLQAVKVSNSLWNEIMHTCRTMSDI